MNNKKFSVVIIALVAICSSVWYFFHTKPHYNIIPINSFNEVFNNFTCNPTTLITFDIDDTLLTTRDPILSGITAYPLLFKIRAILKHPILLQEKYFDLVASIIVMKTQFFLIEENMVQTIKKLQKNGCKIIVLTAIETGSFGIIPSFEEWRRQMLHNFGIDFNNTFNKDIILDDLPQFRGTYPRFSHGILYANMQPKGSALQSLLEKISFVPKAIISFDDELHALESIAHTCALLDIPFTGYHYFGAKNIKPQWDMNKALQELDSVMKTSAKQIKIYNNKFLS
jgi:hypothetical protein